MVELAAWMALLPVWIGSLGAWHWMLDLFSHLRLQYLPLCCRVVVLALVLRRRWLMLAALVSLAWNGALVLQASVTSFMDHGRPAFTLVTFNVYTGNSTRQKAMDHVLATDADVVCLFEVDESWSEQLDRLRMKYPHQQEELAFGNFGIACYTRLPLKKAETRYFAGMPNVMLDLEYEGRPLTIIATHPPPPFSARMAATWLKQLREIAAHVRKVEGDVIVAGDLNATPWCRGMRELQKESGLRFRSVDPVWTPTWGRDKPGVTIPIDHMLVKGNLSILHREVGPDLGSDHRPVMVQLFRLVDKS
jgi:endonuclease/exonuclease/phosphatase (EEP) superfamily protein YafD